jgi:uncharacterized protein YjgD (DUF1641 family)
MESETLNSELVRKIDALTEQVAFLTEQARQNERARAERAELLRDVAPIASSAMRLATEQFQEIEPYVRLDDLLRLVKKLARHAPDIEALLDQLDSLNGLAEVAGPIGKDAFNSASRLLADAERKGYFAFARGGMRIMDNIVTSFSEDDVKQLGDNVVLILRTVKEMTQPEVMNFLRSTVNLAEKEAEGPVDISYRGLLGQMRDPNMRRGLAVAMKVLSGIGGQNPAQN